MVRISKEIATKSATNLFLFCILFSKIGGNRGERVDNFLKLTYKGLKNYLNSIGWERHIDKIFLNGATPGMGDYYSIGSLVQFCLCVGLNSICSHVFLAAFRIKLEHAFFYLWIYSHKFFFLRTVLSNI